MTAPVQRQRWYVMRFLAQWRMSKIIFVPYSKLLVIVDVSLHVAPFGCFTIIAYFSRWRRFNFFSFFTISWARKKLETEKSESLIVHTIEKGYSASDYWTTTEEAQHINTTIYPTDGLMVPAPLHGGAQLPPIRSHHLSQQQQQQQQQGGRSTPSPFAHPTALPGADMATVGGQAQVKPVLASNQVHSNILPSPLSLNPNTSNSHNSNSGMNQEPRLSLTSLTGPELSYQLSDDTVLVPLDDGLLMSSLSSGAAVQPTATSPSHNNLAEGGAGGSGSGNTTIVGSVGGGVGPAVTGTGSGTDAAANTHRSRLHPVQQEAPPAPDLDL